MTKGDLTLFPGEKPKVFMTLGNIEVARLDKRNWTVSGDDYVTYHSSLAFAIREAALRSTNIHARNAESWLLVFRSIVADLDQILAKFDQVVENKGSKKLVEVLCDKRLGRQGLVPTSGPRANRRNARRRSG